MRTLTNTFSYEKKENIKCKKRLLLVGMGLWVGEPGVSNSNSKIPFELKVHLVFDFKMLINFGPTQHADNNGMRFSKMANLWLVVVDCA